MNNHLISNLAKRILAVLAVCGATLVALPGAAQDSSGSPTGPKLTTDRQDYPPFSLVTITGTGFWPNEVIYNQVVEIAGPDPGAAYEPWEVMSGPDGTFVTTWYVFTDDLAGATLLLTSVGGHSGLSAQAQFSDSAFHAELQGLSFGNTNWVSGNLTNWQELDLIPVRVYMTGPGTNEAITVSFDHTKTTGNAVISGFENLYNFTTSPSVIMVSAPTLTSSSGDVWTYSFMVTLTDTNGFVQFQTKMSAGAHNFTGSSLSLSGTPSLGQLQIHVPQPTGGNPNIGVVKSGPAYANPSQVITYSLAYTNTTNSVATGVQLTDYLPAGVSFVSSSGGGSLLGNTLTWDLGTLQRSSGGTVTYQVMVDSAAMNGSTFQNNANIACSQNDPNPTNNQSSVLTTVINGCIPPTIAGGPNNVLACVGGSASFTVAANGSTNLVYQWRRSGTNLTDAGNISGSASPTLTINPVSGLDVANYDVVVTNLCGRTNSSLAALSLNPQPTITCPGDITVSSDPVLCGTNVSFVATSGDPLATITYSQNPGSFFPVGTNSVTATASNLCGTLSCAFNVVVVDVQPPQITCPTNITVSAAPGLCTSNVTFTVNATDNCAVASIVSTPTSGFAFPVGTTTVTNVATDIHSNTASCTFTVTVVDGQLPQITCPSNITVSAAAGQCTSNVTFIVNASDNCGVQGVVSTPASGFAFPVGTTTVTNVATDIHSNTASCTFTVTVVDDQPPQITCPTNITVSAAPGQCTSNVTFSVGATDNCGVQGVVSMPASGFAFPVGTTTVTNVATDIHSNSASCTFTVTVVDAQPPQITCPTNITVSAAQGLCTSNVTFSVGATDNCGVQGVMSTPTSGFAFPVGTTIVTNVATDIHSNMASCTFTVTVVDDQPPQITCPSNITVSAAAGLCTSNVTFSVGATDNCGVQGVVSTPASGFAFPVGVTTVTNVATDIHSNTASCTFTVTVVDDQPPQITCPTNITVSAAPGLCTSNVTFSVGATDNCGVQGVVSTPASGFAFPVGTTIVTNVATDIHSNMASCTFTVTVVDDQPPQITCPTNITVNAASGQCTSNVTFTVNATDNCGVQGVVVSTPASGFAFPVGTTTVTNVATDIHSNTASCTFTVTVVDDQPPQITCPSNITVSAASGQCTSNVTFSVGATDNCGVQGVVSMPASGFAFPVGTTIVTNVATDIRSNTASCTFTVTVVDDQLPQITCPSNITVNAASGLCTSNVTFIVNASDNCGVQGVVSTPVSGFAFPVGTTTVTNVATDIHSNTASCTFTVTVVDAQPPQITCPTNITVSAAPGLCTSNVTFSVGATDNCGVQGVVSTPVSGFAFPVGTTTVTNVATDIHSNTASCTFTVTVVDAEPPQIAAPTNVVANTDPGQCSCTNVVLGTPFTSDNCGVASVTNNAPGLFVKGNTIVTWTATDIHGNTTNCDQTVTVVDAEPPTLGPCPTAGPFALNSGLHTVTNVASDNCCLDVTNCSLIGTVDTSTAGPKVVIFTAADCSGNSVTQSCICQVIVLTNCTYNGQPGSTILPPIHPDGSSVFNQGSTVPAKFRVFDANCNSLGTGGVVTNFHLIKMVSGSVTNLVDLPVVSTTPFTAFRFDPSDQQWIFNINTKQLAPRVTYFYQIQLYDGSSIWFDFGLK